MRLNNVLFLCTGNSCRSQMAEGLALAMKGDQYNFYSAGTQKHGLNAYAVKVMQEVGIDISKHQSKTVDELADIPMDYVLTVCSNAQNDCPYFPSGKIIHVPFDDPPGLCKDLKDEEQILEVYRRVRDEIKMMILHIEEYL